MTFEEVKTAKLRRLPVLRVFNMLGMVAWYPCKYEIAQQKLRRLHPLSWLWLVLAFVYSCLAEGIPKAAENMRYNWEHETIWF